MSLTGCGESAGGSCAARGSRWKEERAQVRARRSGSSTLSSLSRCRLRLKVVLLVRLTFEARNRDSESESYSAFDELEPDSREGDRVERAALSLQHALHRLPLYLPSAASRARTSGSTLMRMTVRRGCSGEGTECAVTREGCERGKSVSERAALRLSP